MVLRPLIILTFLTTFSFTCFSQRIKQYHIDHLQPYEFEKQIKVCSDSAYIDYGIEEPQEVYKDDSYYWLVSMINKEARKYLPEHISDKEAPDHLFQYRLSWERNGKDLMYNLCFTLDGKLLGKTPVLYTEIGDSVVVTVRLYRSKKEINKLIKYAIQKGNS